MRFILAPLLYLNNDVDNLHMIDNNTFRINTKCLPWANKIPEEVNLSILDYIQVYFCGKDKVLLRYKKYVMLMMRY
ncbi:hypothetical protein ABD76_10475 [Paenibacillus dendritiformis]|nr:hypothetical protein [Paenibacillus dendritiformis]